jgi:hypothetical protein
MTVPGLTDNHRITSEQTAALTAAGTATQPQEAVTVTVVYAGASRR